MGNLVSTFHTCFKAEEKEFCLSYSSTSKECFMLASKEAHNSVFGGEGGVVDEEDT